VVRAAELLGIGAAGVRALPMDGRRRLRPDAVHDAIQEDRRQGVTPVAVVATAGTTLTGAVDPIGVLADVCEHERVWLHVDGAYGLPAAAVPSRSHLFQGGLACSGLGPLGPAMRPPPSAARTSHWGRATFDPRCATLRLHTADREPPIHIPGD